MTIYSIDNLRKMALEFDILDIYPTTETMILAGIFIMLAGLIVLAERKVTHAYTALHVIGGLTIIPAFALMLRQKYQHDAQWVSAAFMLAAWGTITISMWREYAPRDIIARWDGYWLTASPFFYAIIRYLETGNTFTVFFSIFGAPALAITLGYFIIGRHYNERNTDLARYPHMAVHYERKDAENRAWWCEVGKNACILVGMCILCNAFSLFMLTYGFRWLFIFVGYYLPKLALAAIILFPIGAAFYAGWVGWVDECKENYKYAGHRFFWSIFHFVSVVLFIAAFIYQHNQGMAHVAMVWTMGTFVSIVHYV